MDATSLPPGLADAIADLWKIERPGPNNLLASEPFKRLGEVCKQSYGLEMLTFALNNALRGYGLPCELTEATADLALSAEEAARRLDAAFKRRDATNIYLCPLDLAGELPSLTFGPNEVRRFSRAELDAFIDPVRLRRFDSGWKFDSARFSQFTWLVVRETISLDRTPGARATPAFNLNLNDDFGRITPYRRRFPASVEDALFALLLAPWEEWTSFPDWEWRCFSMPWVYAVKGDDFLRPQAPPSPESLTWEPWIFEDEDGEEIETEIPTRYPLRDDAGAAADFINEDLWARVTHARSTVLFEAPVAHFFVRAFLTEQIDEFLAHITTTDAALGQHDDYKPKRNGPHPNLRGMGRLASRLGGLLGEKARTKEFEDLCDLRSQFLHGRPMGDISSAQRVLARKLARRAACGLIDAARSDPKSRAEVLAKALDIGAALT